MDLRSRELERRAVQGDLDATSQLLRARIRSGELTKEQLQLAAFLGDRGARTATGEQVGDPERENIRVAASLGNTNAIRLLTGEGEKIPSPYYLAGRVADLRRWGKEVCVRAAAAAVRCYLTHPNTRHRVAQQGADALALVELWLVQSGPEQTAAVERVVREAHATHDEAMEDLGDFESPGRWMRTLTLVQSLGCTVLAPLDADLSTVSDLPLPRWRHGDPVCDAAWFAGHTAQAATHRIQDFPVWDGIRAELIGWLLDA